MVSTKQRLIDVMIKYIKGGENLSTISMQKIAKKALIGKSTIYEYFKSKDILIEEAYLYLINHYRFILMMDLDNEAFKILLKKQIKAFIKVMTDAKMIMEAIIQNPQAIQPLSKKVLIEINQFKIQLKTRFDEIFLKGVQEGIIQNDFSKHDYVIKALLTSLSAQYVSNETNLFEEEVINLIYESILLFLRN